MMGAIQIKCPWCSAILSVKETEGMETKKVLCPVCRTQHAFTEFRKVTLRNPTQANSDHTVFPGFGLTNARQDSTTPPPDAGRLIVSPGNKTYHLSEGENIVGRDSAGSKATVKIDTGNDKFMSREHLIINVQKNPDGTMRHLLALYKPNVNDTFLEHEPLIYGDTFVLKNGDSIELPGIELRFVVGVDDDETIIKI